MDADILALQQRLKILEQANQRIRRFTFLAGTVAVAVLFSGESCNSRTIEAQRFILKDNEGKTHGIFATTENGPSLELYDSNQVLRVTLGVFQNAANLTLKDANGTGGLVLADVPTGPGLMIYDRSGSPRAQLDVGTSGPRLYLEDAKGFSTTVGSYFTGDPAMDDKLNAASVVLRSQLHGTIWRAP